jgi:hypothetical protein
MVNVIRAAGLGALLFGLTLPACTTTSPDPGDDLATNRRHWQSQRIADYYTVDQMFALIADARAKGAAEVRVTYDPLLRYPTTVFIDQSVRLADEERRFEMSGLTPVR